MNPQRLLRRLLQGHQANVHFGDLQQLVEGFGFRLDRVAGSHHIYAVDGQAKPYQIKQLLRLVERYALTLTDEH